MAFSSRHKKGAAQNCAASFLLGGWYHSKSQYCAQLLRNTMNNPAGLDGSLCTEFFIDSLLRSYWGRMVAIGNFPHPTDLSISHPLHKWRGLESYSYKRMSNYYVKPNPSWVLHSLTTKSYNWCLADILLL